MKLRTRLSLVLLLAAGCGGGDADVTGRLWVSRLPTSPRTEFTAFATIPVRGAQYGGSFHHGTLLRGQHDVFRWKSLGAEQAELVFLQDGSRRVVEFTRCRPSAGFDRCLTLKGGPWGVERYQSRERWRVGRGKAADAELGLEVEVATMLRELSDDGAAEGTAEDDRSAGAEP
jgi:hypothetical protein